MNDPGKTKIKAIFVGDSECGKTALLSVFVKNVFPEVYEATVFNSLSSEVEVEEERIELSLWDTSGQPEFDHVRPLSYKGSDVVMICFDISRPETLESVSTKWTTEAKEMCVDKPIVLVGCKTDLRSDICVVSELAKSRRIPVTYQQGCEMAKLIDSVLYLECSSKTKDKHLIDVFEVCTLTALGKTIHKKRYKPKMTHDKSCQKKSRRCIIS
ncbi:rho-related GTP-binding protein RhoE-like [Actinia tenebrosa]|uniref:Rho-related GTP-binding protein RhoE-like n=1 Tax=Actinia tenebrosa TaxID=6105 RepID=A0A6P8IJ00_ACTTE|nr:rho-related GTP-binding protein RhoE-like [Actinia tenebrosa]